MLKLVSINIETNKHYQTVLPFLDTENPDVICLQEAPEQFAHELQNRGYQTAYAPMLLKETDGEVLSLGILIASKLPFEYKTVYYQNDSPMTVFNQNIKEETLSLVYLMADIECLGKKFTIATTHMIDTDDGTEDDYQILLTKKLLSHLKEESLHVIVGDFNMPRGYNRLYDKMTELYKDNIPPHYQSSLDRNLHKLGRVTLDQPIFDKYMVDHLFTQEPYLASNVRLQFGVSDHAAIVANLSKSE